MDEEPPPPNDPGTPEQAIPAPGDPSSAPPSDTATAGQDAVVNPGAAGPTPDAAASGHVNGVDSSHLIDQLHKLSSFDTACLIFFGLSVLLGLIRGGSRELSGILVWIGALWLALRSSNAVMAWANPSLPQALQNSNIALWVTRIAVFIIGVLVFSTLVDRVSYIAKSNLSRSLDGLLGLAFGGIRGYALIVVFCLVAGWASGNWLSSVTQGSVFMPAITKGIQILQGYVPPSLQSYLALPDTNTLQETNSQ